jgi:hypothetical protein
MGQHHPLRGKPAREAVVPVIAQELLAGRREQLRAAIRASFSGGMGGPTVHHEAFCARTLGIEGIGRLTGSDAFTFMFMPDPSEVRYAGYPRVACVGYGLGAQCLDPHGMGDIFLSGLRRIRHRSDGGISGFSEDDVALLGVADGLARLRAAGEGESDELDPLCTWLVDIIRTTAVREHWSRRMRALADELLGPRGRMRVTPSTQDTDALALDFTLREAWPQAFVGSAAPPHGTQPSLVRSLLTDPCPSVGDLPRATVWLCALETLVDAAAGSLLPSVTDTARILRNIQHALKRWPWEEQSSRRGVMPTRWLIDDEYDVQALLWAILYPLYQAALVDETYLPNWGNVQPRVDLGITTLKLIIEVKIARQPRDFSEFEEQIAGDLGLYFKDTSQFDRMIVFVYDDCDRAYPERYQSLTNALLQRERIEDVIVVRRPSMIPNRGQRKAGEVTPSGVE